MMMMVLSFARTPSTSSSSRCRGSATLRRPVPLRRASACCAGGGGTQFVKNKIHVRGGRVESRAAGGDAAVFLLGIMGDRKQHVCV